MHNIHYSITAHNPLAHIFDVVLTVKSPALKGQKLRLPSWIPGSYMIRDFAKNIIEINATCNKQPLKLTQLDKSTWQLNDLSKSTEVVISYSIYAWDLSVRSAHLDQTHGFFNGTSVFLEVIDQSSSPCRVDIIKPSHQHCEHWQLATSLEKISTGENGFGEYSAKNYADLIDHPVEMAAFKKLSFTACGVPHDIVLTGRFECDEQRIIKDLTTICEHHIRFFAEPAPIKQYVFLIMVVGDGYGGLEHRASTSLLVSRKDLPQIGVKDVSDDYRQFLGLCSHEYFHTWNVKRMTPAVYLTADLSSETYTPLLWAFEGITSYYDDLALLRTGLISEKSYFELLAQTITRVLKTKGRHKQSISESSFNAWTKFYKQDENAQNAIVSYYAKGTLVALCLDLTLRQESGSTLSLDDVMRSLWQDYLAGNVGFNDDTIQLKIEHLLNKPYPALFNSLLRSVEELPLAQLLKTADINLLTFPQSSQSDKGGKAIKESANADFGAFLQQKGDYLQVVRVSDQGAAQTSGLSAGDNIIAVNQLKLNLAQFETMIAHKKAGDSVAITAFRRDELMQFKVLLTKPENNIALLTNNNDKKSTTAWPYALS